MQCLSKLSNKVHSSTTNYTINILSSIENLYSLCKRQNPNMIPFFIPVLHMETLKYSYIYIYIYIIYSNIWIFYQYKCFCWSCFCFCCCYFSQKRVAVMVVGIVVVTSILDVACLTCCCRSLYHRHTHSFMWIRKHVRVVMFVKLRAMMSKITSIVR